MIFFILVCILLVIGIPLLHMAQKKSGRSNSGAGDFTNDSHFYTSSASERYGEPLDSSPPNASDETACNESSSDSSSDSDSGSCDSGGDSGSSSD